MFSVPVAVYCEWTIRELDPDGNLLLEKNYTNLITNAGRNLMLENNFGLAGSSVIVSLCVGASTTAALITDTTLTYELIGNATRRSLTNTAGVPLSASDIVNETITIGSVTYQRKLIVMGTYLTGDGNNGNQFGEYGLNTTLVNPGTPTGTSGTLYNHLIDGSPSFKDNTKQIQVQITIRY